MLYREIIAVCSQIHTKCINTLCGQKVELLNVKLAVHIGTTGLQGVKSVIKTSQLMPYREIIAVCSEIHTKHINTLCGQNVEFVNIKLAVRIETIGLCRGPVTSTPFCWQSVWSLFMVTDLCPVRVSIPASFPSSGYRSAKRPERVAGSPGLPLPLHFVTVCPVEVARAPCTLRQPLPPFPNSSKVSNRLE